MSPLEDARGACLCFGRGTSLGGGLEEALEEGILDEIDHTRAYAAGERIRGETRGEECARRSVEEDAGGRVRVDLRGAGGLRNARMRGGKRM